MFDVHKSKTLLLQPSLLCYYFIWCHIMLSIADLNSQQGQGATIQRRDIDPVTSLIEICMCHCHKFEADKASWQWCRCHVLFHKIQIRSQSFWSYLHLDLMRTCFVLSRISFSSMNFEVPHWYCQKRSNYPSQYIVFFRSVYIGQLLVCVRFYFFMFCGLIFVLKMTTRVAKVVTVHDDLLTQ